MVDFIYDPETERKIIPVIFAVDASSSMGGERIHAVNLAIKAVLDKISEVNTAGYELMKYAVLRFASDAKWLTNGFIEPESENAPEINAGGLTGLGAALELIEARLGGFKEMNIPLRPIICFITHGEPTDDYKTPLKRLSLNGWYKIAVKFAVVLENGDARSVMEDVCGNVEGVTELKSGALLKDELVRMFNDMTSWTCLTASMVSESPTVGTTYEYEGGRTYAGSWVEEHGFDFDADGMFDDAVQDKALPIISEGMIDPESGRSEERLGISQVQFSAVVPKRFTKGAYSMIDISVYEEEYRHVVDRIIANADGEVREVIGSPREVVEKTEIRIELYSPDIDASGCNETQVWGGRYLNYSFTVVVPADYDKKQALFIASVYFDEVIATKLVFIVDCTVNAEQRPSVTRKDINTAFISYARRDRRKVARIIQGMQKARPDMDIFFDIDSIRSGEYWEKKLMDEIDRRDVLFLCWSRSAKKSKWVEKEWRYALDNKGLDSIEPVPLVSPQRCKPPEELNAKHFSDRALFYMKL